MMKIEAIKTTSLVPYAKNAKRHDETQVSKIAGSIREFGFNNPVLIDGENGIIAGHGRVMAAQKLGLSEVPCIRLGHLSDTQRRAYILADNRLAEIGGGWDEEMLKLELADLAALDVDVAEIGFGAEDLAELEMEDEAEKSDADAEPQIDKAEELRAKWGVEPGQLWELGEHRLLCGDSMSPNDVDQLMGEEKYDVVVLDPPFEFQVKVWTKWIHDPCVVFGQARHIRAIPDALWRFERIVAKKYRHRSATVQIDHRHSFVVQVGSIKTLPHNGKTFPSIVEQEIDRDHDHAKPLSLLVEHLTEWMAPWDIVIDPFSGSGTTIMAAEQLGRKCRAIEISPAYVAVAIQRWADATGKEPKRLA